MQILKIIFVNVVMTLMLVMVVDISITASYFSRGAQTTNVHCTSAELSHDYCAGVTELRFMDSRDRIYPIVNFVTDESTSRYEVPQDRPPVTRSETIYLLGDSFIQAEELYIEERFEHALREVGFDVYARGYSSWSSMQFSKIAKELPVKEGDVVFIFSMTNDYTPAYGSATINVLKRETEDQTRDYPERNLVDDYWYQSFLRNRLSAVVKSYKKAARTPAEPKPLQQSHDRRNMMDCASLPPLDTIATPNAHNYIELSKSQSCWSKPVRESVDLNVKMLGETVRDLRERGARIQITLVPSGWVFENQNTVGREIYYQFPIEMTVTQDGLADYLKAEGLPLVDGADILRPHIGSNDNLYYPVDGHWNAAGHKVIFRHLVEFIDGE